MQPSVFVFALAISFVAAVDPWVDFPECAAIKAVNFQLNNCPSFGECTNEVHVKAKECLRLESENEDARACGTQEDVKKARFDWLKAGCKYHNALTKCMVGESSDGFSEAPALFYRRKRHSPPHSIPAFSKCWLDVHKKMGECRSQAATCNNFNSCSGAEDSDNSWNAIAKRLHTNKQSAMHVYKDKMKNCIRARHQPAVFL